MSNFCTYSVFILSLIFIINNSVFTQVINSYTILNVTLDTFEPSELKISNGRLIWKDKDQNTGNYNLKFYNGGEIIKLDSNLSNFSSDIDGNFIVWSTTAGEVKVYDINNWEISVIGNSYNPDGSQKISISNGLIAYPSASGNGSEIILKDLITNNDTTFSEGVWNLEPSVNQGQLVWIQNFLADSSVNNVYFFNGTKTINLTSGTISKNYSPLLKDGQVIWRQQVNNKNTVLIYDGDSLLAFIEDEEGLYISGYDISNGIAVVSLTDSSTHNSEIKIYNSETETFSTINDTARIHALHIDNGLICWASGSGVSKKLFIYDLDDQLIEEWGNVNNPVIDNEQIAWTLGDAVSLLTPVEYEQISSGLENGWAQTRFKNNEGEKILWGNFDNSTNSRLFYNEGNVTTQLTDSLVYKDFLMTNDEYSVWRHDFTSLYLYDGINEPRMLFDSLQCENMYLAEGSIGFHGFKANAGNNINQAWLYKIEADTLIQLTDDTSETITNTFTLVDGDYACWYRESSDTSMLMLYDGIAKKRLTDSLVNNEFAFMDGKIVWSESVNGVLQIFLYDVVAQQKEQISNALKDAVKPATDGNKIIWFETGDTPETTSLWYYDIQTKTAKKVVHFSPSNFRWYWLSNGKAAWAANNEVFLYDGNVISQLTSYGSFNPASDAYVDNDIVVWNKNNPEPNIQNYGQIFRGKLHPHVSFSADKISGKAPFTVSFTNHSFQGVQKYHWDFGDGETSNEKNPFHTYQTPGVYSVTLTVEGIENQRIEKKINLIRVDNLTSVQQNTNKIPAEFFLYQNYPNPFNPVTRIKYSIPASSFNERGRSLPADRQGEVVTLKIYDILGREISTLVNEERSPGIYEAEFNASGLASGIYFCRLKSGSYLKEIKLLLLK